MSLLLLLIISFLKPIYRVPMFLHLTVFNSLFPHLTYSSTPCIFFISLLCMCFLDSVSFSQALSSPIARSLFGCHL
jgi:hypothetical protein